MLSDLRLSTYHAAVTNVILLVDDDKAGRECLSKATKDAKLHERFQFRWKREGMTDTEVEDLISTEIYWETLQNESGAILNQSAFRLSTEKWSIRMKRAFESAGKPWNDSVESNAKVLVASRVSAATGDPIEPAHRTLVQNVFGAVNNLVSAKSG